MTPDQLERERLRALITRNLLECCEECRRLLRDQLQELQEEERRGAMPRPK